MSNFLLVNLLNVVCIVMLGNISGVGWLMVWLNVVVNLVLVMGVGLVKFIGLDRLGCVIVNCSVCILFFRLIYDIYCWLLFSCVFRFIENSGCMCCSMFFVGDSIILVWVSIMWVLFCCVGCVVVF